MTLKPNQAYFPPLVYNSVEMTGGGTTYTIEVILSGDTITATTQIPNRLSWIRSGLP
jgi:hypothetical protein